MKKNSIVIIGGGGHCGVIIDALRCLKRFDICGIVDPRLRTGEKSHGVVVLGNDDILAGLYGAGVRHAFIGVGSIGDCRIRKALSARIAKIGFESSVIAHPGSIIASDTVIEPGAFIAAGAVINTGTKIGKHAIINTSSSVDHDCRIGSFVHIAPGATLSGEVTIKDETHIGAGATVIQGISIGKRCMIGAGATVRRNVPDGEKLI